MPLIKSISGIRGTIGGKPGDGLSPVDIVRFVHAYCATLPQRKPSPSEGTRYKVVVGRDARISGEMVENLVVGTLTACGVDVVKIGLASTPTTEMAVTFAGADGGIIITASHNPRQWNALKLLGPDGEFLSAEQGRVILDMASKDEFDFAGVDSIGKVVSRDYTQDHLDAVLALPEVDAEAIREAGFKVVLDAINSVGGIIMPQLLSRLGVECVRLNCTPDGDFAHNPEPLPSNLEGLSTTVVEEHADLGISVDPDVDRLAFICEDGKPFGEEYTLVSVASYLFERLDAIARASGEPIGEAALPYAAVSCSNLSSSRALKDVTERFGGKYFASAVGEVNVTAKMHSTNALIGGEGNGGVIFPALHYGRDAIAGTALFLSNLAHKKMKASELRKTYPDYHIAKKRLELSDPALIDRILEKVKAAYAEEDLDLTDGVKVSFEEKRSWVHLRRSNTEPIIRIYSEAPSKEEAEELGEGIIRLARNEIGE